MKQILKYLREERLIEPLGEVTLERDNLDGLSGECVHINGKDVDIFVADIDYINWIERDGV